MKSLIPLAIMKKSTNNRYWRGCTERETLLHCWWECKLIQPLLVTVWWFLRKIKNRLPYDTTITFLDIYLKKTMIQREICTLMLLHHYLQQLIHGKKLRCLMTEEWIKKKWYIYTMEYYPAIKRIKHCHS